MEAGKITVYPLPVAVQVVAAAHSRCRNKILVGRQMFEYASPLEHMGNSQLDPFLRHERAYVAAEKIQLTPPDFASFSGEQAADRFQRCALAGTVCAQQRHHPSLGDVDRYALDGKRNMVVDDFDIIQ